MWYKRDNEKKDEDERIKLLTVKSRMKQKVYKC